MNHLLRPRIRPSFLASSIVGPCDVPLRYASGPTPCGYQVARPSSRSRDSNSSNIRASHNSKTPISLAWHTLDTRLRYALPFTNHGDAEKWFALKFEILLRSPTLRVGSQFRNPKHETNTKSEFSNVQNVTSRKVLFGVLVI